VELASSLDLLPENPAKDGFNQAALIHTLTYYGYCPPKKDTLYNSDPNKKAYLQNLHRSKLAENQTQFVRHSYYV
jgi:hypothetical protein